MRCHGVEGGGRIGPSFKGGLLLRLFATADAQQAFVSVGRMEMPGFRGQLTTAQIAAVVRYEREVLTLQKP